MKTALYDILFVCKGNICRSPVAESVFLQHRDAAGLADAIFVDSAGTHGYHIGELPDSRTRKNSESHGIIMQQRARQFQIEDFKTFDCILVMDQENYDALLNRYPEQTKAKVRMYAEFHPDAKVTEIPDPYYGVAADFEKVFTLCSEATPHILHYIQKQL